MVRPRSGGALHLSQPADPRPEQEIPKQRGPWICCTLPWRSGSSRSRFPYVSMRTGSRWDGLSKRPCCFGSRTGFIPSCSTIRGRRSGAWCRPAPADRQLPRHAPDFQHADGDIRRRHRGARGGRLVWQPPEDETGVRPQRSAVVALNLLALIALSREVADYYSREMASLFAAGTMGPIRMVDWQHVKIARDFTYSALWMAYGAMLMVVGFWRRSAFVRWQALVLIAFTIGKCFCMTCRNWTVATAS